MFLPCTWQAHAPSSCPSCAYTCVYLHLEKMWNFMSKSNEAETYHHLAKNSKRFDYILAKVIKVSIPPSSPFFSTHKGATQSRKQTEDVWSILTHAWTVPGLLLTVSLFTTRCLCMAYLLWGLDGACISSLADLCKHMLLCHIAISMVQEGLGIKSSWFDSLWIMGKRVLWGGSKFPFLLGWRLPSVSHHR